MMRQRGNFLAHQRRRISLIRITFPDGLLDRDDFSGDAGGGLVASQLVLHGRLNGTQT
jgi:hypothetical protein